MARQERAEEVAALRRLGLWVPRTARKRAPMVGLQRGPHRVMNPRHRADIVTRGLLLTTQPRVFPLPTEVMQAVQATTTATVVSCSESELDATSGNDSDVRPVELSAMDDSDTATELEEAVGQDQDEEEGHGDDGAAEDGGEVHEAHETEHEENERDPEESLHVVSDFSSDTDSEDGLQPAVGD